MIFRNKKLNAFMTGSLVALVAFGHPSRLLAQSNSMDGPIQGITSTTQEAPTTAAQVNDVMTGLAAGVGIGDLIEPKPDPIREHTAFLSSMWTELLDSDYSADNSYLSTGEWTNGPSGIVTATNENGNSVSVDVALSLEILPEQWGSVDQETLDAMSSVSARFGVAWTTMTNTNQTQSNILIWWIQWNSPTGVETAIGPLNTITQEDIDLTRSTVSILGDFLNDPLNYNIDNFDPDMFSLWSSLQTALKIAVVVLVVAIVAVTVAGAVIVVATAVAEIAGVAAAHATAIVAIKALAAIIGTTIAAAGTFVASEAAAQLRY